LLYHQAEKAGMKGSFKKEHHSNRMNCVGGKDFYLAHVHAGKRMFSTVSTRSTSSSTVQGKLRRL
jgi:hypothetical protein